MPDRSLRLPPLPTGSTLLREGRPTPPPPQDTPPRSSPESPESPQSSKASKPSKSPKSSKSSKSSGSSGSSGSSSSDDNPFAPPPEGTPDRPWQPRRPEGGQDGQGGGHSPWGGQWSDRQPGRAQGGGLFGDRPGQGGGQGGPEGPQGPGSGMRWDPTDPAQRRARYALLCGMWGFFFALFGWPYVALLLGALALHWGISALRAKPRTPDPDTPAPTGPGAAGPKPQTTAAVSGLVTGSLALALVAAMFTAQFVYSDYYTCVNDALTSTSKQACETKLPKELRPLLGARD
ncbi:hypothetical protein EOT10_32620 [Streptomyces antnestii]|uniref:Integral membrane protein n=1 Tax=Streptomyces antnestii TaxID=2494256 RepID=A0A437P7P4_9ACTN|nr:hypothetical protein [Streptomyces sp. San01]RVU18315.1 hypothetical protein EOT10_32620 [Streptomyces sp. San01]